MSVPTAANIGSAMVAGIDLGDEMLATAVRDALGDVERSLRRAVSTSDEFTSAVTLHLIEAGGKRFRPIIALLAAQYGRKPTCPAVIDAAASVELVHVASLYHDDVMDEAAIRRGVDSANARWSNSAAILAGDYIFGCASRLIAASDAESHTIVEAARYMSDTMLRLAVGQLRDSLGVGADDRVSAYLETIRAKTASLMSVAAWAGARFADADTTTADRLEKLGEAIGMVFQISDDIIDITSPSEILGKAAGTDLREGVLTLPIIYALRERTPEAARLRALLAEPVTEDVVLAEVLELVRSSGGVDRAMTTLREKVDYAKSLLRELPHETATRAFTNIIEFTASRTC
ncbi:polyprenyl synthetase family protein [Nocardia transvalensis]|uniref:polyprenyl synthetase family protein n=1 Tax=Nocardia transvalensis TaxID=37333 RepID=UPI001892FF46|nr:polyprenyl synthetase family protein [Nocardia transvalensis]MBF6333050.1 polyprenyl synthetase family protein [Nocardia transvalensis]